MCNVSGQLFCHEIDHFHTDHTAKHAVIFLAPGVLASLPSQTGKIILACSPVSLCYLEPLHAITTALGAFVAVALSTAALRAVLGLHQKSHKSGRAKTFFGEGVGHIGHVRAPMLRWFHIWEGRLALVSQTLFQ
jgi:hypothetical protein